MLRTLADACKTLQMESYMGAAMDTMANLMKEEKFWEWRQEKMICGVISLVLTNQKRTVSPDEIATLKGLF